MGGRTDGRAERQKLSPSTFKFLWLPLLPERMKKIQLKVRALQRSQHYPLVLGCLRGAYSEVSDGILPEFKLIRAFMVGLVTCKNEEDPSKNEVNRVVTTFLPL